MAFPLGMGISSMVFLLETVTLNLHVFHVEKKIVAFCHEVESGICIVPCLGVVLCLVVDLLEVQIYPPSQKSYFLLCDF